MTSLAMSSDGSGSAAGELVTLGAYSVTDNEKSARVAIFSMASGALLTDWLSPVNSKLQTDVTVRMSGQYAGAVFWGDSGDVPTCLVLRSGSAEPLLAFTTPGSMVGLDIVLDAGSSNATADVIFFVAAGKHVPANEMGDGGDAYAWRLVVPPSA